MVNKDPAEYWVRACMVADHLIPLSVTDRTLGWLHNSVNKMELRCLTHSNSKVKRLRGQKIEMKAHECDELGGMSPEAYTN